MTGMQLTLLVCRLYGHPDWFGFLDFVRDRGSTTASDHKVKVFPLQRPPDSTVAVVREADPSLVWHNCSHI